MRLNISEEKKNMKNLETKVRVDNFDLVQKKFSFAKEEGLIEQKDTYYLLGKTKLKLREEGNVNELILYVRPEIIGSRESRYTRCSLPNSLGIFIKKLFIFVFGEKIIVNKDRLLLLYKHTRIHLDKVKELGEFIEIETVFDGTLANKIFIAEHDEVKKLLGLEIFPAVSGSYSDLLLKKKIVN